MLPGKPFGNCLFMTPALFDARMARLRASGATVLPLGEAVARLAANDLPPASVAITIDDGWVSTHTHMLPTLERYQFPATLYATTWYAGRAFPVANVAVAHLIEAAGRGDLDRWVETRRIEALPLEQRLGALRDFGRSLGQGEAWLETRQFNLMGADELADAHRRGLDIQLHTHRHIDVHAQIDSLAQEVADNRAYLTAATGAPAEHFCYPSGTWHPRAAATLVACGVRSATLVDEGINAPGADPYALRRFLDGPRVTTVGFDAYLSGTLHYFSALRGGVRGVA